MENDFDLFDFAAAQNALAAPDESKKVKSLSKKELQQAAFAFLYSLHPTGIAADVHTRKSKYKVAAAGFWRNEKSRKGTDIVKTALVVMCDDADYCFSDCAGREMRMDKIRQLQERKDFLEAEIRCTEPHLAAADDLFSEFRTWDYNSTGNPEYCKLCRELAREIQALAQGSKLEYIRRAGNADLCYLAIPGGLIDPGMIPAEWGVVELTADGKRFKMAREAAVSENVTPAGRIRLALNIARSASAAVRFCAGVDADGSLRRPPRRRGKIFTEK